MGHTDSVDFLLQKRATIRPHHCQLEGLLAHCWLVNKLQLLIDYSISIGSRVLYINDANSLVHMNLEITHRLMNELFYFVLQLIIQRCYTHDVSRTKRVRRGVSTVCAAARCARRRPIFVVQVSDAEASYAKQFRSKYASYIPKCKLSRKIY
jgi:hypothetical protein